MEAHPEREGLVRRSTSASYDVSPIGDDGIDHSYNNVDSNGGNRYDLGEFKIR